MKKVSTQIKEYSKNNELESADIIILNTGFFSLEHDFLKRVVADILRREIKTIKFAFIFTQSAFNNTYGDTKAVYYKESFGEVPDNLKILKT
jgi:hypothetical protein